jgi:hypothetical protein
VEVTKPFTRRNKTVTQENFIIELFCRVDDMVPKTREHIQAKLSLSELVTLRFADGFERHVATRFLSLAQ